MPYFNFDLVVGAEFQNQGGMILENTDYAIDKADSLANELRSFVPSYVRQDAPCALPTETSRLYRAPVEPVGRG